MKWRARWCRLVRKCLKSRSHWYFLYFWNVCTSQNCYMILCESSCWVMTNSVTYPKVQGYWRRWKRLLWYYVCIHKRDHSLLKIRKINSQQQGLFKIDMLKVTCLQCQGQRDVYSMMDALSKSAKFFENISIIQSLILSKKFLLNERSPHSNFGDLQGRSWPQVVLSSQNIRCCSRRFFRHQRRH